MTEDGADMARAWLRAAGRPEVAAELEAIYGMIADQIEARGPACWASGRCCNFGTAGHRLYVTGLEAAYTLRRAPVTGVEMEDAGRRDGCPYQRANLCGVHGVKPLGCRVYFCDRSAQRWQEELSERALALVRGLHDRAGVEYRYGEWRALLKQLLAAE